MSSQPSASRCAVVVVSYSSSALLEANLARISCADPSLSVYVVDNTVEQGERRRVEQLATTHGWTAIFPERNLGFGEGCNVAAAQAIEDGAEQILLLNPDAFLDQTSLSRLRRAVEGSDTTLAGPAIVTPEGQVWSAGVDLLLETGDMRARTRRRGGPPPRSLEWLSGACLLLSSKLWQQLGGFDADYFLYWEDVDLCARVHQVGGEVLLVADAVAVHDEGATHRSTDTRVKSAVYYYYNVRNRMLFARKHLDKDGIQRWRRSSVRAAYQVLLRGGRRQFVRPLHNLWPALRGLWAGRQFATESWTPEGRQRSGIS